MQSYSQVNVKSISVAGNERTNLSFFDAELDSIKEPNLTAEQLSERLSRVTDKLLSMDMFEAVDLNLQINSQSHGIYDSELKVNVKEKGIPFLKVATYLKAGSGSEVGFELQSALRNPTGYGETFKVSAITTQSGAKEYLSSLFVPNVGPQKLDLNVSAKSSIDNQSYFTAYKQQVDAFSVELATQDKMHQVVGEYALRDEIPVTSVLSGDAERKPDWLFFNAHPASAVTTNTAMSSVKTSLKYLRTFLDDRDSLCNPTSGSFLQGSVEIAAPPGNAQFLRTELVGHHHRTLGPPVMGQPGLVASVVGSIGILRPILLSASSSGGGSGKRHGATFLSDRYQLGGSNSLRGFAQCGTGPRAYRPAYADGDANAAFVAHAPNAAGDISGASGASGGSAVGDSPMEMPANQTAHGVRLTDSLGGDLRTTLLATLSVPVPVPLLARSQVRAFAFFNGGLLSSLSNLQTRNLAAEGLGAVRASVGGGFSVAAAGAIRLEATYSIPLLKAPQDQTKGFQIGVGLTIN